MIVFTNKDMKLYSFITNENKKGKQQGGQKNLVIKLLHETDAGDWRCGTEEIEIQFNWNDGKPNLFLLLPKSWQTNTIHNDKDLDPKTIKAVYLPKAE